jgi:SAM-dependent methyltransferase
VIPLNLDITQKLPFADSYFHAIFCMDSIHYYGGSIDFMRHLLKHLRPGGRFCIGSPCFNEEFSPEAIRRLPREYDDGTDLWRSEFSRYHSPQWWAELLDETGIVDIAECTELEDGVVMWEDELLYNIERCGWPEDRANTDFAQIAYGYAKRPYLTHFVLTVQKRKAQQGAAADADRPCC